MATPIAGYDEKFETIPPPGSAVKITTQNQEIVNDINIDKSSDFFKFATSKVGLFELRKEGY